MSIENIASVIHWQGGPCDFVVEMRPTKGEIDPGAARYYLRDPNRRVQLLGSISVGDYILINSHGMVECSLSEPELRLKFSTTLHPAVLMHEMLLKLQRDHVVVKGFVEHRADGSLYGEMVSAACRMVGFSVITADGTKETV